MQGLWLRWTGLPYRYHWGMVVLSQLLICIALYQGRLAPLIKVTKQQSSTFFALKTDLKQLPNSFRQLPLLKDLNTMLEKESAFSHGSLEQLVLNFQHQVSHWQSGEDGEELTIALDWTSFIEFQQALLRLNPPFFPRLIEMQRQKQSIVVRLFFSEG